MKRHFTSIPASATSPSRSRFRPHSTFSSSCFVFGPIASRRLGRSLGVDPIPFKTCNWNCVYCQLGTHAPLPSERKEWVPTEDLLAELFARLEELGEEGADWVSFVGSGEPTLHVRLGAMIAAVRKATSIPVAVITNGSLLHDPQVRAELVPADLVLPSLDAGSERVFRRIDRARKELSFENHLDGLRRFSSEREGKLWLEIMLVAGLNDDEEALRDLARAVESLRVDQVHLNVCTRPPTEPWVEAPTPESMERACAILGEVAKLVTPPRVALDLRSAADPEKAVVELVQRHPVEDAELRQALAGHPRVDDAGSLLDELEKRGAITRIQRDGKPFWTLAAARYRKPERS